MSISLVESRIMAEKIGGDVTTRTIQEEAELNYMYNAQPHALNAVLLDPVMPSTEEYWCMIEALIAEQLYNKENY